MKGSWKEIDGDIQIDDSVNGNKNVVGLSGLEIQMIYFCEKRDLKIGQNLTNDCICKMFRHLHYTSIISFDSLQDFMEKYLKVGEKISFDTLNLFLPPNTRDIQNCTLGKLRTFIEKHIKRSETYLSNYLSNMNDKIKENRIVTSNNFDINISSDLTQMQLKKENTAKFIFLVDLFKYIKIDKELLDEKNQEHIKYFTDWQQQLLKNVISKIMDENYEDINYLATGLLKFKYETRQYDDLKDLQNDILQYVKSIVFYYGQSDCGDCALDGYLSRFKDLFDKDTKDTWRKIFDREFVQELKNVILGEERKITKWYQIRFLHDVLDIASEINKLSYSFDEAYDFIFKGQDKFAIQQIVSGVLVNEPLFVHDTYKFDKTNIINCTNFVDHFLDDKNPNIDSECFKTFCQIFYLKFKAEEIKNTSESTSPRKSIPPDLEKPVNDYLLSKYFLSQKNISLNQCADLEVRKSYRGGFYFNFQQNHKEEEITDGLACQIDNKMIVRVKNSLVYTQNTRIYEIFIGTVFLVFGFVSLAVLKSAVDILSSFIKVVINVFCAAIVMFKREEYFWMIILPIKELVLGVLFVIFSPIICVYNNFCGSKHLFHICGSGKKLITFSNWRFYNSKDKVYDFDNLKNFSLTDINLWFVIKYIFGFACVVRLKKSEDLYLSAEIKLTKDNKKVDDKDSNVKVCNKTFQLHRPILRYTNEYSPSRYFERT